MFVLFYEGGSVLLTIQACTCVGVYIKQNKTKKADI
jgi:hypothetical protein